MSDEFKHLVLTEFHTDQDMDRQIDLFGKYCLPSMLAQTCSSFVWLLLCPEDMKPKHMRRLEKLDELADYDTPFFLFFVLSSDLLKIIPKFLSGDEGYLITTQVPYNCCLHRNVITIVQTQFERHLDLGEAVSDSALVDFKMGYALALDTSKVYSMETFGNIIPSLFENLERQNEKFFTVLMRSFDAFSRMPATQMGIEGWKLVVDNVGQLKGYPYAHETSMRGRGAARTYFSCEGGWDEKTAD